MKTFIGTLLLGLSMTVCTTASALPIFSHTTDGSGLFSVTVDGTSEPSGLFGLYINDIIDGVAIAPDFGTYRVSGEFAISDEDFNDIIGFTFTNSNNLTQLTGTVFYGNESSELFSYDLAGIVDNPPPPPEPTPTPAPTPNVPEPSTFLLLGIGLIGIGVTRSRKSMA